MSPSKCDADIIFLDETDDSPNMRGRSQTWSFTKPPKRIAKEPIVKEKSVEDIFNELLESANEFMEEPEDLFGFRYEDLSDIEEGVQKCFNLDDFDQTSPGSVNQRSPVEHKKKTDLAKICGFQSYHHIIEKAIHCSPDKM
uniref:Uncharacterized protein n=1 Tax=Acrobeloides nanus TaxID=290746 RepID=A0A914CV54_9BILA